MTAKSDTKLRGQISVKQHFLGIEKFSSLWKGRLAGTEMLSRRWQTPSGHGNAQQAPSRK